MIELKAEQWLDYGGEPRACYPKADVDAAIAELKAKLDKTVAERDGNQVCIDALKAKLEDVNELVKESKELLKESQRMHQRCADNASKQIFRLKRALYKACANWALFAIAFFSSYETKEKWRKMFRKCLKKAEEYK